MSKIMLFLLTIRWQDVVDISLNSYILFRLYVIFRNTNAFRVMIGFLFLWFFQRIAISLGLILTSWAVQGITAAAALIIIVVFRKEIRSILQTRNFKTILWGFPRRSITTPVDLVAETVHELAQEKTGALIVIPGNEELKEDVHSGIPWQGLVSKEMLKSVFWLDSPVHDGAAIIRGDRVIEVGAVLPLSQRKDLPSYYGTRHRAAAGLAESTDALVIVVSEERGSITIAKGSRIHTIKRQEDLAKILRQHMGSGEKEKGSVRREKIELTAAAMVSVLFIVGMWFGFTRGLDTLITVEIPVEYMNRNAKMEIVDTSVNSLRLDLSGSRAIVNSIRPEQIRVRLDLGDAAVGKNRLAVTSETIDLPPGVVLKKVEPSVVEVVLDVPIRKVLPVQVVWTGRLGDHLIMRRLEVEPEKIEVIGGSRILNETSTVYTDAIPLDVIDKAGMRTVTVGVFLNPPTLTFAPGSKGSVTVKYYVEERKASGS
ncbi:MAG: diadenylate cyclase [Deltaproteobacteria bacterium]|nr:diadenylate cyclase [Deltaproteobacteria bacterium]